MPTVPYNPVPDVAPQAPGVPGLRVQTPIAAFGGTVAQAIESVGGKLDQDGNEIFQRAMALQDLNNRTAADKANTDYTIALGQKHAAFSALEGQNAVKALPQYTQDVQDLREEYGQGLNPMARKLYDVDSRGQMARTIFNGAGHAGEQNKRWQEATAKSALQANRDGAYNTADDDAGFQAKWNAVPNHVATLAGLGGWDDTQTTHEVFKERSGLLADRIKGLARTNPLRAEQMLNQAMQDKTLEFSDWQGANSIVHHEVVTTGSRVVTDKVNAGWDPRMTQQEIDRTAGVQEPLLRIIKRAQQDNQDIRFTIAPQGGRRTPAEQAALVARGTSHTMNSSHLDGRGIDLVPVGADGKTNFNDKATYQRIEEAVQRASEELGIPLSSEHDKIKSWDPGHFSIPSDLNYHSVPTAIEETLQSRIDRATQYAREVSPNDADFQDAVRQRVTTQFNQDKAIERDQNFRNSTTVGNALLGLGEGQKVPTTVEELRLNPTVRDAYDNLPPAAKSRVLNTLTRNSKGDFSSNETNFRTYQQLRGEAENDPAAFLQEDLVNKELPRAWRGQLLQLQVSKSKNAQQDPRITHAIQVLGPVLQTAHVDRTDKDRYETFIGTLHDQLSQFEKDNKRPPKDDEINTIGARLLQEQHTHFWQNSQGMFEIPVPQDEYEKIKNDPAWLKKNIQPSDQMIQRVWTAKKYQELYGTPKPAQPSIPTPTVPQSK